MNTKTLNLLWASLAVILASCVGNDGPERPTRSEFIKVYETSEDKLVDDIQIPFDGVQDGKINVLSNVSLQWKYLVNPESTNTDWFQIKSVEEVEPGHTVVTYDAASLLTLNSLERRSGRLSFSCPEAFLGKFLTINQGYSEKFYETFDEQPDQTLVLTGRETFTTDEYPMLNSDYFDYISFNVWAETTNEFLDKNITLDITVSGGHFYETNLKTYRVNVPLGTGAEKSNLKYLLLMGDGERMSAHTKFIFSVENSNQVYVHVDNLAAYTVSEAEMLKMFEDEDFDFEDEGGDWI
ncbi:MAG: hypothetical protein K5652_07030 [Bacteroidales bacterium]|nr:hypothetical protein [Bacteroidales bacterium]